MPYQQTSYRKPGSGDYRHKLVFQRKTETRDSFGSVVETWATDFEDWGAFYQVGSREFPMSQKRQAETTARFEIRYRDGINPDFHRISFNGKVWNIYPPSTRDGQRIVLEIEASEIA